MFIAMLRTVLKYISACWNIRAPQYICQGEKIYGRHGIFWKNLEHNGKENELNVSKIILFMNDLLQCTCKKVFNLEKPGESKTGKWWNICYIDEMEEKIKNKFKPTELL